MNLTHLRSYSGSGLLLGVLLVIGTLLMGCTQAATPEPAPTGTFSSGPAEARSAAATLTAEPATAVPATPVPSSPPRTVTLTFAFPDDPQLALLAQGLIDGYAAAYPWVQIVPEPLPAQDYQQLLVVEEQGRRYDLLLTTNLQAPRLIEQGVLLDVQPLIDRAAQPQLADFHRQTLVPWQRDRARYGLPISAEPQVLFYNRTLFDALGEPYPTAEWTWPDWFASARRLAATPATAQPVYGIANGGWTTAVLGNGGQILNADNSMTLLDRPEAAEGVQQFADLVISGVSPLPGTAGGPDPIALFREQQVATLPAPAGLAARLPADLPFEWGIAPVPSGPTRAVLINVAGLAIGAASEARQAAFDVMLWAVGPAGQALPGTAQPFAATVLEQPGAAPQASPENELITAAVAYGRTLPATPQWPEVANLVNTALVPVWQGETTAAAAYLAVAPEINALLASSTALSDE